MLEASIKEYHNFLDEEYNQIKSMGEGEIGRQGIIAPSIRLKEDRRRSLDLYYPLPVDAKAAIDNILLSPVKKLFEELHTPQIVFGSDWLHASSLVIMAAEINPPFNPESDDVSDYNEIARQVFTTHSAFEVSFSRVVPFTGNPGGILLGGFPQTLELDQVREELRNQFDDRGLRRFERRPLQIFHATLARWDNTLWVEDAQRVVNFLDRVDQTPIWSGRFDTVTLAIGGYDNSPDNTKVIDIFKLRT